MMDAVRRPVECGFPPGGSRRKLPRMKSAAADEILGIRCNPIGRPAGRGTNLDRGLIFYSSEGPGKWAKWLTLGPIPPLIQPILCVE